MRRAQIEVILAAVAFAASVPATKLLLADVAPLALSGVLYISAGSLCAGLAWLSGRTGTAMGGTNSVRGAEWVWLLGAVVSGGVLAPLLLFLGLREVSGHVAGLLLNFEAVFTVGLGVLLSGEYLGHRGWLGAVAILLGAVLLSLPHAEPASIPTRWAGIALVIGACALWGLDNNLTQRVSLRDARQIVAIKGLAGGITSLSLAAAFGGFGHWNAIRVLIALAVGAVSFGLSIALFVRGLRQLGVIQTGMLFALAPGFAAILSWALLRETIAAWGLLALGSMTAGALLLATDRHEHLHEHEAQEHAHEHTHDEHHQHDHTPEQLAKLPHAHWHRHQPMVHRHPHVHDVHHRHRH
ncbi:MAG: EamA/RhaT family transporter [Candidatus Eisenbacteria bacterium]|uniref:EamA/RhaT family transporter n=1 Tax=Eiseniibacteriota bacterium TaxID=2212470 RepID=A0A538TQ60_UNCEI|nr:MAG: EamA/RhaT family transporter [Candidatus Eisenbacteria bacterium]TMQ65764.1 MAG: EamA/RhaT family transporter [Candidatus Eisenbacteria bacterium]